MPTPTQINEGGSPRNQLRLPRTQATAKLIKTSDHFVFLLLSPELQLKISTFLNPIDFTCLSLVNKHLYRLTQPTNPFALPTPLSIGSPTSTQPVIPQKGCHHCAPVLYYPAHCELHFHLRSITPSHLTYCAKCCKFTRYDWMNVSDAKEYCGVCREKYRNRFERGRRMLQTRRPGGEQEILKKWYND